MIGLRLLIGKPSPRDDPESIEPKIYDAIRHHFGIDDISTQVH